MARDTEGEEIIELAIVELRRTFDWVDAAYQRVKLKTITYLGGGLATLAFLYANGDTFIPKEAYGKIFYFIGLGLVLGALVLLFISMLPRYWEFSIDHQVIEKLEFKSKKEYLSNMKEAYLSAYKHNLQVYEKNHKFLSYGFYPLIFGVIILVVLKLFG